MFPYKRAIIDYGFEFVNNIESIPFTKCFLTREPLLIMGLNLFMIIESINLNFVIKCFLVGVGFLSHGGLVHN